MKKMKRENTQAHLQMEVWTNSHNLIHKRKSKGQHLAIIPDVSNIGYLKFYSIIILCRKDSSVI